MLSRVRAGEGYGGRFTGGPLLEVLQPLLKLQAQPVRPPPKVEARRRGKGRGGSQLEIISECVVSALGLITNGRRAAYDVRGDPGVREAEPKERQVDADHAGALPARRHWVW